MRNAKGFTLIELLVVLAIIALLLAVDDIGDLAKVDRGRPAASHDQVGEMGRLDDPPGGSTAITSAPSMASTAPASWPRSSVRSSTR